MSSVRYAGRRGAARFRGDVEHARFEREVDYYYSDESAASEKRLGAFAMCLGGAALFLFGCGVVLLSFV